MTREFLHKTVDRILKNSLHYLTNIDDTFSAHYVQCTLFTLVLLFISGDYSYTAEYFTEPTHLPTYIIYMDPSLANTVFNLTRVPRHNFEQYFAEMKNMRIYVKYLTGNLRND
jgi:hypothetical protein